jgi:hypothetical protein
MQLSDSNQDQISLISISIYLPLLIFFILLSISSSTALKQQYNDNQLTHETSSNKLYILREQQIYNAKELLRSYFNGYSFFQEVKLPLKSNYFLVFASDYQNILQNPDSYFNEDIDLFVIKLFKNILLLKNIHLEIILPQQFSYVELSQFKATFDSLLLKYNIVNTTYSLGISNIEEDKIYFNFKFSN